MIILPAPWQGLHPAFPKQPDPFNTNSYTNAPVQGGTIGLAWALGAALFNRSPVVGLKVAAWSTVASLAAGVAVEQYTGRVLAQPYLESKGLTVPRQKLIERPFHADENSFIIAGGFAAISISRMVAQPWALTGWKRTLGAFSMGAFGGSLCSYAYHWPQLFPYVERRQKQKQIALMYTQDVKNFHANRNELGDDRVTKPHSDTGASGMTSLQQLIRDVGGMHVGSNKDASLPEAESDRQDELDPKPHFSDMREGERVFRAQTNYKWKPGPDGIQELEDHISTLRARRTRLAQEAEQLFHYMAAKEAEYYDTSHITPQKDERRISLEVLGHVHINAYLEISQLDWCIADSQKNILQIRAMQEGSHWIPDAPTNKVAVPTLTLQLLDELERDTASSIDELEAVKEHRASALNDSNLEVIDAKTGQVVKNPYAAVQKDIEEIEKVQEEAKKMSEAIQRLRNEFERGNK